MTKALELMDFQPVGKGRPRFNGRHAYTPERTRDYESAIRTAWVLQNGAKPISGALNVTCEFDFVPPVSWSKKRRENALKGGEMVKKPDTDNLMKAVLDALNGVAYFDDCQVQTICATKRYAERAAVRVWISVLF